MRLISVTCWLIWSMLSYQAPGQQYHLAKGSVTAQRSGKLTFMSSAQNEMLPVLCTQSSSEDQPINSTATPKNMISVQSNGNTFVGFRNLKSFRFNGIPFADKAKRFEYSTLYSKTGQTINATAYGPDCAQIDDHSSSENCLFMNIQTPYIPKAGCTDNLRPVVRVGIVYWLEAYADFFSSVLAHEHIRRRIYRCNSGPDSGLDTGNLAAREDIVACNSTIDYRH